MQALACMGWGHGQVERAIRCAGRVQLRSIVNDYAPITGISALTADAVALTYKVLSGKPGFTPYAMGRSAETPSHVETDMDAFRGGGLASSLVVPIPNTAMVWPPTSIGR